jgi:hypothetical protein
VGRGQPPGGGRIPLVVSVPVVTPSSKAGRGRLLTLVIAAAGLAVAAAGCGEKSEPAIHPPTTAATTTTAPPTTTVPQTQSPTAPVPKTTP